MKSEYIINYIYFIMFNTYSWLKYISQKTAIHYKSCHFPVKYVTVSKAAKSMRKMLSLGWSCKNMKFALRWLLYTLKI